VEYFRFPAVWVKMFCIYTEIGNVYTQIGQKTPSHVVGIIAFAFKVILGVFILGAGILIGDWVKRLIQGPAKERPFLANLAKAAIVTLAFGLLLGSIAIAAAIVFGIGSREIAGREVESWVKKLKGEK
jgi:hypothetical protein